MTRRRTLLLSLVGTCLLNVWGTGAGATTWRVEFDPAQPVDRVGQVVLSAAEGDSVLVGPGHYFEHIPVANAMTLTIIGTEGATATILDGSVGIPGRSGSVLYCTQPGRGVLTLIGLSLINGTGTPDPNIGGGGGGVYWWGDRGHGSVVLQDCRFEGNIAVGAVWEGGAASLNDLEACSVERCEFKDNSAGGGGGDLIIATPMTCPISIHDCTFDLAQPFTYQGDALSAYGGDVSFVHNTVTSSGGLGTVPETLYLYTLVVRITDNTFIATGGPHAARIWSVDPAKGMRDWSTDVVFCRNHIWTDSDDPSPCIQFYYWTGGTVQFEDNVLIRAPVNIEISPSLAFNRNVLYRSPTTLWCAGPGSVSCCVAWPQSIANGSECGPITLDRVLQSDPLFCEDAPGDFDVQSNSPCVGSPDLPGCGVIGGVAVGCTVTPAIETTWGQIKARYRGR